MALQTKDPSLSGAGLISACCRLANFTNLDSHPDKFVRAAKKSLSDLCLPMLLGPVLSHYMDLPPTVGVQSQSERTRCSDARRDLRRVPLTLGGGFHLMFLFGPRDINFVRGEGNS